MGVPAMKQRCVVREWVCEVICGLCAREDVPVGCVSVWGEVFGGPRAHSVGILHHAPEGRDPSLPVRATWSWA